MECGIECGWAPFGEVDGERKAPVSGVQWCDSCLVARAGSKSSGRKTLRSGGWAKVNHVYYTLIHLLPSQGGAGSQ